MIQIQKCPTCNGRASVRASISDTDTGEPLGVCSNSAFHDLADLGPAAVELLREWSAVGESMAWEKRVDALLASLPEVRRG